MDVMSRCHGAVKDRGDQLADFARALAIRLHTAQAGQGIVEFALIIAVIALVALTALRALGVDITQTLDKASQALK
jgi:Flp pilus assembly pilin Flp